MIDRGKKNVLGIRVDALDYEAAVNRIISAARQRTGFAATALAVHGIMTGVLDQNQRYRLNHLDLAVPDGQPVRWALNWLYQAGLTERVYGPTLMLRVCEVAARERLPVYFYGSRPEVLKALVVALKRRFPDPPLPIAGEQPSRFRAVTPEEKMAIAHGIRESGAHITFVGLGCPRQEVWVYEYRRILPMPLVAVGAAFDFHAGTQPQAPLQLQRAGLEWLYRLAHEPARLWRRYLFLNPLYLALLGLQAARLVRFDPERGEPPSEELRVG